MKSRILSVSCLCLLFLSTSSTVTADLSVTSQWRIEQSVHRCSQTGNALIYTEYWGDAVTDENRETVCIAERFAQMAASEGDGWLKNNADVFVKKCKEGSKRDEEKYYSCLQSGMTAIIQQLSPPCVELGQEGLWDEGRCKHLISYIFAKEFEVVLEHNRPLIKKLMDIKFLGFLFNPIVAILLLIFFVLDVVVLTDPGNWMRISQPVLIIGIVILVSMFLEGELRFLGMAIAVLLSVTVIIWNHVAAILKPGKKEKKKAAATIRKLLS